MRNVHAMGDIAFILSVLVLFFGNTEPQTLNTDVAAKNQWEAVPDANAESTSTFAKSAQDILTSMDNDSDGRFQGFRFTSGPNFVVKLTLSTGQTVATGSFVDILDLQSEPSNLLHPFEMTASKFYHLFMVDLDTWKYDGTKGYTLTGFWIAPNLNPYSGITSCDPGTFNVKYVAPDFAPWPPGQYHRIAFLVLSGTSQLTAAPTTAAALPAGYTLTVYDKDNKAAAAVTMRDGATFSTYVDAGIFIKVVKPTDIVSQFKQAKVWETTKWKTKGNVTNSNANASPDAQKQVVPYGFKTIQSLKYGKSEAKTEVTQTGTALDLTTEDFTKSEFTYGPSALAGTLYTIALTMLDDDTATKVEILNLLVVNEDGSKLQTAFTMDTITAAAGNNLVKYTAPSAATAGKYYRCVLWIMKQSGSLNVEDAKVKAPASTDGWSVATYAKDNNLTVDGAFMVYTFKPAA